MHVVERHRLPSSRAHGFSHYCGLRGFGLIVGVVFILWTPLWAIPSPDLVVNFVASAAQVLGVLTLLVGGFAFKSRQSRKARNLPASGASRWALYTVLGLLLVS